MNLAVFSLSPKSVLYGPRFDGLFIFGTIIAASLAWTSVLSSPNLFELVLLLDLWLLGYHHVIATYTRISFDRHSFIEHRFDVLLLPLIVLGVVAAIIAIAGIKPIVTLYLFWQSFHYTRQSEGIAKAYLSRCGLGDRANRLSIRIFFYSVPMASFLTMLSREHHEFLFMPIYALPIPEMMVLAAWVVVLLSFAFFLFDNRAPLAEGKFSVAYISYLISHGIVFIVGYAVITDLNYGWLGINIWHNAQYLLFVWLANVRRFKDGEDPQRRFLSYICQPERAAIYFLVLIAITAIVYTGISQALLLVPSEMMISSTVLLYQALNFHHYIVDSKIWKLRKPAVRREIVVS